MKKRGISLVLVLILACALVLPAGAFNLNHRTALADGGTQHSIAVTSDGAVWTWGSNKLGQLGLGPDVASKDEPTQVPGLTMVDAVAAGYNFSLALRFNGEVYAWGGGISDTPTLVSGLDDDIVAIAAGQPYCLALSSEGVVWQWVMGQRPTRVQGAKSIVAISAGNGHYLALARTGEVYAWGNNRFGQLGDGTVTDRDRAQQVKGLTNIISISAGGTHCLAADAWGNVYAWGNNEFMQLGVSSDTTQQSSVPTKVNGVSKVIQVAASNESSVALTEDGRLYAWGYGGDGQLGAGRDESGSRSKPEAVSKVSNVTTVSAGLNHFLCTAKDRSGVVSVYAWGLNKYYQVGSPKTKTNAPVQILKSVADNKEYSTCLAAGASAWAYEEIMGLYQKELVSPRLWGDYQSPVTRAEFAHLLVTVYERVKGTAVASSANTFNDISNEPFAQDILKAHNLGFVSGTSADPVNPTFTPNGQLTRAQAAKMLCSFIVKMTNGKKIEGVPNLSAYYTDAKQIPEWAAPYVEYAYTSGVMKGSEGRFMPNDMFSKEQSLITIARLVESNGWKAK